MVDAYKSIIVGTLEHDSSSQDDPMSTLLSSNEWYNRTCKPYKVKFTQDFKSERKQNVFWNVNLSVGKKIEINPGIEDYTTWTDPVESYILLMTLEPYQKF
jgi:hypothetical protein